MAVLVSRYYISGKVTGYPEDVLTFRERVEVTAGRKLAAPAGEVVGRFLGRLWYRGECESRLPWTAPIGDFARAVGRSIEPGYEDSFGSPMDSRDA
jgi:hypothetical protein